IYTSGSTGKPKGTLLPHRSIMGLILEAGYIHLGPEQTFLQHSSLAWDAHVWELWTALLSGARCVLYPAPMVPPEDMARAIQDHGITALLLTPKLFNAIIDLLPQALAGVQQLLVGGEALSVPHVRRALERLPQTQLVNAYGPTEAGVIA